jgi:hypothetical protein
MLRSRTLILSALALLCLADAALAVAPKAPKDLVADGVLNSTTDIRLEWVDQSNNEDGFEIQRRFLYDVYATIANVPANTTTYVDHSPGAWIYRVRAKNASGNSAFSNQASGAPNGTPSSCNPEPGILCINNGRFRIELEGRTPTLDPSGTTVIIPSAPDSGLFYFFSPTNIEMLIKVLNGCGLNNRYWLFYAATTNIEFLVVVRDTGTGRVRTYFNPLDRPAPPVQDTDAFATCP